MRSQSTTWEWKRVRKTAGPASREALPAVRRSALALRARNRCKPIDLKLWYVGGATSSWVIAFRGTQWRFEGAVSIEDVGAMVNGESLGDL
jgi:hypothetical protein